MSPKEPIILKELRPKTLLLGVYSPKNQFRDKEAYFEEFLNLVKTLDLGYDFTLMMKVRSTDPFYFLTKGKRGEIEKFCKENQDPKACAGRGGRNEGTAQPGANIQTFRGLQPTAR